MLQAFFRVCPFILAVCLVTSPGCKEAGTGSTGEAPQTADEAGKVAGNVTIDGSSTVYPVSMAVAEEFGETYPEANPVVKLSGTGGGMKKFAAGEIDIADASRAMKESEAEKCQEAGIEFIRLSVAYDGLAVVVNPQNDWCESLTVEQLKKIWQPENPAQKWSDLDPAWPDEEFELYGPGTDSGTFDYFTEEIVGETKASRTDYSPSEDDNVIVNGVSNSKYAMGYFGYAYYAENSDKLKVIGVDSGAGAVKPSMETVMDNSYAPLSRPLFIYVSKASLKRPVVAEFCKFYLTKAADLSKEVGYVPVPADVATENDATLKAALQ